MRIAVLLGGSSPERDVSFATGREIAQALRERGHDVVEVDTVSGPLRDDPVDSAGVGRAPPSSQALARLAAEEARVVFGELPEVRGADVIFNALHGGAGEDGRVQARLDLVGVPYTGSGALGCALAMDKLATKQLFEAAGVPTPTWLVGPVEPEAIERTLGGFPVVVKPSREGSTVGVSVAHSAPELREALQEASAFEGPPLIEKFIPGRELAVGVLGEEALPVVEIRPSHEIYDYECKYTKGMSEYEVPAPIGEECTREVQLLAQRVHRLLRLSTYSRVDFRLDAQNRPWCLEANSLPGMTPTSLVPKAARAAGTTFSELCERIVQLSLSRAERRGTRRVGRG